MTRKKKTELTTWSVHDCIVVGMCLNISRYCALTTETSRLHASYFVSQGWHYLLNTYAECKCVSFCCWVCVRMQRWIINMSPHHHSFGWLVPMVYNLHVAFEISCARLRIRRRSFKSVPFFFRRFHEWRDILLFDEWKIRFLFSTKKSFIQ